MGGKKKTLIGEKQIKRVVEKALFFMSVVGPAGTPNPPPPQKKSLCDRIPSVSIRIAPQHQEENLVRTTQ
jgi:hypothetical protein